MKKDNTRKSPNKRASQISGNTSEKKKAKQQQSQVQSSINGETSIIVESPNVETPTIDHEDSNQFKKGYSVSEN